MNVVLLLLDQQRAESLSCYGHPTVRTPNYDRLASQGVLFDQCHTQSALCSPVRCAMLTGLYPHVSGHRTLWNLLKPHEPNMFRYLRQSGYHVVGFGKNDLFTAESAAESMDLFEAKGGSNWGPNPYGPEDGEYYSFMHAPVPGDGSQTGDARCVRAGIDFLRSRRKDGAPFLLYLPLTLPHPPYSAPEPYHSMYGPDEVPPLRPVAEGDGVPLFRRMSRRYRRLEGLDEGFMRRINAVYLGMNGYVDSLLGSLLDALDGSEVAGETAFILCSDHGDFAGDYGLVEKIHNMAYDVMTRVPLIIRAPGCKAGHVVGGQVEVLDIMATVLELAGVRATHTHFSRSLVGQVYGGQGDPDRPAFFEHGFNAGERHCFEGYGPEDFSYLDMAGMYSNQAQQMKDHPSGMCRTVSMRTPGHRIVRRPDDVDELFDLTADPRETRNVYGDEAYAGVRAELNERMLAWLIRTSDVVPHRRDPRYL